MKTVRDVSTLALKKLGVLRAGGEPQASEGADAAASLQSFYMECISQGTFGRVYNVQMSSAGTITPGGNQHVNVLTDDGVTVDLPSSLPANCWDNWRPDRDYGWGLNVPFAADPNIVVPRDKSVVQVTYQDTAPDAAVRAVYVYDGTVGRWLRVDTLNDNDEAPLSARSPDGLASVLAVRMTDQFGAEMLSPVTMQSANRYKVSLVSNFGNADDYCC